MTRRKRKEAKLEKRLEWAAKREAKASQSFNAARKTLEGIPLGQPILVGHHSEKRHRATLNRADSAMRSGIESQEMAKHHASQADGISHQLDHSIFSDDANAIEALEQRIEKLQAQRDRMKCVNTLYRKGDAAGLAALGLNLERLRADVARIGYSWVKTPYETYQLALLGKRIGTDRKRIEFLKREETRQAECEAAGGVQIKRSGEYASVRFAEKPAREILQALRDANYHWSGAEWHGIEANLPAPVAALVEVKA